MNSNFCFLKKIDNDLYSIIIDAEKLYRDEYFDQCITQIRKFGENICQKTLGYSCTSFDESLANLKDRVGNSVEEKEFVEDLYFLKKHGNNAVHSSKSKNDPFIALECLQRAFETALNYSVYKRHATNRLLKRKFDTELLITGKKSSKSLAEKYEEEKQKVYKKQTFTKSRNQKPKNNRVRQISTMEQQSQGGNISVYWIIVGISFILALGVIILSVFL